jgi:methyl-accepting chemotaxis protein
MGQVGDFATAKEQSAVLILAAILAAGILAFLVFSYFFVHSITRPVKVVIDGLRNSAEQVASVSQEVATSSHKVAAGASSQAAGIEETSSSLEEMASMTRQNAQNAEQAAKLAKEANQTVFVANDSMTKLAQSVGQISQSSEETFKIIKTIDEIAFQTNLLALNAAVEAARAGEAGAGFAVVADEVRNLAMRAADAARSTASLIEDTVKKVKEGTALAERTNQAFAGVAASTQKVGELVGEITAASEEQAQGIEQVNKAISEMDKVTQENAANSEELASASEEMSSQAREMQGFMDDLVSVVDGSRGSLESSRAPAASSASSGEGPKEQREQRRRLVAPRQAAAQPKALTRGKPSLNPAHVIPLREAELEDF